MWTLRFGRLEVEKAYLVPEQRSDMTLQWREARRGAVAETMDAYALRKANKCTYYNRCGPRYLRSAEWDLTALVFQCKTKC